MRARRAIAAVTLAAAAAFPLATSAADAGANAGVAAVARVNDPYAPSAETTALDAVFLYDRAHAAVAERRIPPFIAYTQRVTFARHGKVQRAERSRIILRTADGHARIVPLAVQPGGAAVGPPKVADRPLIFPTTTFGFVRHAGETPSAYEPPASGPPSADSPPVIGHVTATTRDYNPTIAGRGSVDGREVYVLRLEPRRDPEHFRIRAMTIDALNYEPLAITIEVYAHAGPISSKPLAIAQYEAVDGVWVIRRASIDFVARFGPFAYGGDGTLAIDDVSFPASEPDALFDANAAPAHDAGASPAP